MCVSYLYIIVFLYKIDPETVKKLDKNLFLSEEIQEVYKEIMQTVPTDHLRLDEVSRIYHYCHS